MRKISVFLIVMILAACTAKPTPPSPAPTNSPVPATTIPPTFMPTETPWPHTTVDVSTMEHKLLMGYQGWFTCPGDGSKVNGYFHWFKNNTPDVTSFRVDMWPDASELTPDERCQTDMKYPDGQPAYLYSAYNPKTVMRHFQWMSQYGVDGVFLQRFGSELTDPPFFDERNVVTKNVRAGAEAFGRVFAMMYDTSGMDTSTFVNILEKDWKYMVDVLKVTESPVYLHHNGKPVLAIWGLGFTEHPGTPDQAMELVNFFENNPDPKYQVTLMGGVPTWWRILQNDSLTDPGWADYYCALDVISPWTVGRYTNNIEADLYKLTMIQDMAAASQCGAEYMPVVYPGSAFHNDSGSPFNEIPRQGGNFYWRQVYNAVSIGVPMIYNAMFDEVDEATAMYKIAATKDDQPVGVDLISMDTDGYKLPSDWYLRLAGAATQMLRGEVPLAHDIPIESGAIVPPTPSGTYRIRIQITTSSDWSTFDLKSGGTLVNPELVSVSPEAVNLGANGNQFSIGQPITRANSGASVELVVDVYLSDLQAGVPLQFVMESGAIGRTTVKLFNYLQDAPVEVKTAVLNDTSKTFEIAAEKFIAP
jgi:hypothetical protein